MLSEFEQKIVDQNKIWGFASYMQVLYFDYDDWKKAARSNQLLTKEQLEEIYDGMNRMKSHFDIVYLTGNDDEMKVLQLEKMAWALLSEHIASFISQIKNFLGTLDIPSDEKIYRSTQLMNEFWELLQEWNIISCSYKAKYERRFNDIPKTEQDVQNLIDRLRTAAMETLHLDGACVSEDAQESR